MYQFIKFKVKVEKVIYHLPPNFLVNVCFFFNLALRLFGACKPPILNKIEFFNNFETKSKELVPNF